VLNSYSKQGNIEGARKIFDDVSTKQIDWPEAIFEAWTSFEHFYGTLDTIDVCYSKIWRAQGQLNDSRMKVSLLSTCLNLEFNIDIFLAASRAG